MQPKEEIRGRGELLPAHPWRRGLDTFGDAERRR